MSRRAIGLLSLVLVMFVWGSATTVTKAVITRVPPLTLALLRFAVASFILFSFALGRRRPALPSYGRDWATIAGMGFLGITVFYVCNNLALCYSTATQGTILQSAIPAITAILAVILLAERLPWKRILGIAVSLLGAVLVVLVAAPGEDASNPVLGGLLMLGAVLGWALYTILAKRVSTADQLWVTACSTAIGTLFLVPLVLIELRSVSLPVLSDSDWLSILYLAAFSTAAGNFLYNQSLAHLDASQAANFINLIPVFGIATAILFLGETIIPWQFLGGAFVLFGVWLAT